jgi:hypothetical protein
MHCSKSLTTFTAGSSCQLPAALPLHLLLLLLLLLLLSLVINSTLISLLTAFPPACKRLMLLEAALQQLS